LQQAAATHNQTIEGEPPPEGAGGEYDYGAGGYDYSGGAPAGGDNGGYGAGYGGGGSDEVVDAEFHASEE
jgi:hypothetical protein